MSRLYSGLDCANALACKNAIAANEIPNVRCRVVRFMASRDFGGQGRRRGNDILSKCATWAKELSREDPTCYVSVYVSRSRKCRARVKRKHVLHQIVLRLLRLLRFREIIRAE